MERVARGVVGGSRGLRRGSVGVPGRGLSDPEAPADRASEYGIEEWVGEEETVPTEQTGDYAAAEWTEQQSSAEERVGDYDAAAWSSEADDSETTAAVEAPAQRTEDPSVSQSKTRPADAQERAAADLPDRNDELAEDAQQWVAVNVDRDLGVTVGEALDTPDVPDDTPEETDREYSVGDWSSEEPPAETDTSQEIADWSDEPVAANGSEASAMADAETSADADTTTDGGVWDSAGETAAQPQGGKMVFDNVVAREEPETESDTAETTRNTDSGLGAGSSSSENSSSTAENTEEKGDDDPFDGRGELYDGDDTYDEGEDRPY